MYKSDDKVILFDGDVCRFKMYEGDVGGEFNWTVEPDGSLKVGHGDVVSTVEFGDAQIHIEFKNADMPDKEGQAKSNSGVFIHGIYEVQILDSYGLPHPLREDDCGAMYKMYPPLTDACLPPEEWQSYDIFFRAPRFAPDGSQKEPARVTVMQNGMMIHNNVDLSRATGGGMGSVPTGRGPLLLQDHGDPVSFRNIWLIPIE